MFAVILALTCTLACVSGQFFPAGRFQPQPLPANPLQPIPAIQTIQPGTIQQPGNLQPIQPGNIQPGTLQPQTGPFPGQIVNPWIYGTCSFNATDSNIRGRVDMRQLRNGGVMQVRVQVMGLPPTMMSDTEHGMHVHEYGDIDNACYAAGPHYDSDSFSFHGSPNNPGNGNSHEGDMGNFRQTNDGIIDTDIVLRNMNLFGDLGVVGRAAVLKDGRDDLGRGGNSMSLQTGNSGPPIACCVIGYSDASNWNNPMIRRPGRFAQNNQQIQPGFPQPGFQTNNGQFQQGFQNNGQNFQTSFVG